MSINIAYPHKGLIRPQILYRWAVPKDVGPESMLGDAGDVWMPFIRNGMFQGFHVNRNWSNASDTDAIGGLGPYCFERLNTIPNWRYGQQPMYLASLSTVTAFIYMSCRIALLRIRFGIAQWALRIVK